MLDEYPKDFFESDSDLCVFQKCHGSCDLAVHEYDLARYRVEFLACSRMPADSIAAVGEGYCTKFTGRFLKLNVPSKYRVGEILQ